MESLIVLYNDFKYFNYIIDFNLDLIQMHYSHGHYYTFYSPFLFDFLNII